MGVCGFGAKPNGFSGRPQANGIREISSILLETNHLTKRARVLE